MAVVVATESDAGSLAQDHAHQSRTWMISGKASCTILSSGTVSSSFRRLRSTVAGWSNKHA